MNGLSVTLLFVAAIGVTYIMQIQKNQERLSQTPLAAISGDVTLASSSLTSSSSVERTPDPGPASVIDAMALKKLDQPSNNLVENDEKLRGLSKQKPMDVREAQEARFAAEEELGVLANAIVENGGTFTKMQDRYVSNIARLFGGKEIDFQASLYKSAMRIFLEQKGVQDALRSMSHSELKSSLRSFRQAMGMDQASLDRWAYVDEERAYQRQVGLEYMSKKKALEADYSGESLQQQLNALRVGAFGELEAERIKGEEASGYHRFEAQQFIGLN